jgi:outer membrane biosynthesis protein TonB/pSer/pThr/pTyr-binding forkhead associated (FHA) protein
LSGQPAVLQVVILRDGLLVGTEVFVPGSYTLGSSAAADLRLDDPAVKTQHATLYFQNGKVAVQDSGAAGVFVNGHKVHACEVRPVDEISCGPFILKTRILAHKPSSQTGPPAEVAALLKGTPPPSSSSRAAPSRSAPRPSPVAPPEGATMAVARAAPASPLPGSPPGNSPAVSKPAGGATMLSARHAAAPAVLKNGGHRAASALAQREVPARSAGENLITSGPLFEQSTRSLPAVPLERRPATRKSPVHRSPQRAVPKRINAPAISAEAKGAPRLYLELYWGAVRRDARSFARDKKPVIASDRDGAQVPLWGFALPEGDFVLAESDPNGFRLYVPPSSTVEKRKGDHFHPLGIREMERDGGRAYIALAKGGAVRLAHGEMTLVAYVAPRPTRVFVNPLRGAPWLLLFFLAIFGTGFIYFVLFGPKPSETADFSGRNLPPVAIRLIAPEPRKKQEAQKKLEAIKEEAPKKEEIKEATAPKKEEKRKVVREKPHRRSEPKPVVESPPPAENKALKALAKLSAAGPATGDILAAVDKLGSGPGSKNAKNNYKLSGLIGKAPIANAGLGTFGLGGGGRGGAGMLGAEILRGKGGGGIGAMGAGGVGRGAVGGTVTRASARSVSVQGSIDREAVAKVVNAHLQEVRSCYERALLREPALAGKVVLEWTISPGGKVTTAKTKSSTLKSSAVEACILQSLKSWQFPPAKGGIVIVSYPFLFNSVGY